jgi:hypothetical protein
MDQCFDFACRKPPKDGERYVHYTDHKNVQEFFSLEDNGTVDDLWRQLGLSDDSIIWYKGDDGKATALSLSPTAEEDWKEFLERTKECLVVQMECAVEEDWDEEGDRW